MTATSGAEIYASVCARGSAASRAVEILTWEIRHGDTHSRKAAETALSDHATRREIAAIKRHVKS